MGWKPFHWLVTAPKNYLPGNWLGGSKSRFKDCLQQSKMGYVNSTFNHNPLCLMSISDVGIEIVATFYCVKYSPKMEINF